MFSGLVQESGILIENSTRRWVVQVKRQKMKLGDSVAVNGVCLTVAKIQKKTKHLWLTFELSDETLTKTTLYTLKVGTAVNIEPALTANAALGGHIVQGHVDGIGRVGKITKYKNMRNIFFETPKEILTYIVPKGSITIDGVSLTAAQVNRKGFSVALIPYTLKHTTLKDLKEKNKVNLEADIIGKYVAQHLKRK